MAVEPESDPDQEDQARWLRQVADNGPEASASLRKLMDAYTETKFARFLNNKRFDNGELEDLLQDIWLGVLKSAKTFKPGATPSPWLWRIARNKLNDALGKRMHKNKLDVQSLAEDHVGLEVDRHAARAHLAPHAKVDDCQDWAFAKLMATHPEAADLLRLSMAEGWTLDRLAEHRGSSRHATAQFLSQARIRLRDYNQQCLSGRTG